MTRMTFSRLIAVCTAAALVTAVDSPARADNDSVLTLGFGAGVGYRHASAPGTASPRTFVNQANLRVKMLWVLGADLSVDLTKNPELTEPKPGELRYAAKSRLTALFYPIVSSSFAMYLGTGVGAGDKSELLSLTAPGNSYHAGGGFEIHVTDHFTVDASFYMIVPGYASMKAHVEQLALEIAQSEQDRIDAGGVAPQSLSDIPLPDARVGDYITPRNYELMIRFFLFL